MTREFVFVALVTHSTGHGSLTEVLTIGTELAMVRAALKDIDTRYGPSGKKFSFGSEGMVRIEKVLPEKVYGKYEAEGWEWWKPASTLGGLSATYRGYGQVSEHNPDWILFDREHMPGGPDRDPNYWPRW